LSNFAIRQLVSTKYGNTGRPIRPKSKYRYVIVRS